MQLHPRDAIIKKKMSAEQLVGMTIWAEARAEAIEGEIAVGCVIRNRLLKPGWWGTTWEGVCLAPWQFSCWIPQGGEKNYLMLMEKCDLALKGLIPWPGQQLWIAEGIINGAIEDRCAGATHYYSPAAMKPRNSEPKWARGKTPVMVLGSHRFYKGV